MVENSCGVESKGVERNKLSEKVLRVGCVKLKNIKTELELFLYCMTKSSSLPRQPKTRNAKTRGAASKS